MDNDQPEKPDSKQVAAEDQAGQQTVASGQLPTQPTAQSAEPAVSQPTSGQFSKGETAKYVVKVDQNLCIGAASCVALAPKIFQLNSDNKAYVVDANGETEENLKAAAQSCPVNAIILENKESGKQEYP